MPVMRIFFGIRFHLTYEELKLGLIAAFTLFKDEVFILPMRN